MKDNELKDFLITKFSGVQDAIKFMFTKIKLMKTEIKLNDVDIVSILNQLNTLETIYASKVGMIKKTLTTIYNEQIKELEVADTKTDEVVEPIKETVGDVRKTKVIEKDTMEEVKVTPQKDEVEIQNTKELNDDEDFLD